MCHVTFSFTIDMKLYQALRNVAKFRTVFDFGGRDVAHWFPGHMAKGDSFASTSHQNMSNKCLRLECVSWLSFVLLLVTSFPHVTVCRTEADESQHEECGLYLRDP